MTITLDPKLEARLLEWAQAEGISVSAYMERLISAEQSAEAELESLALGGLRSGEPIEVGPGYWKEKHRRLEERLKRAISEEAERRLDGFLAILPDMPVLSDEALRQENLDADEDTK